MNIADIRKDYALRRLDESDVDADPFKQFHAWLREAIEAQVPEPTAMTLATAGASGRPAARIMLLKALDDRGFVFYTNYASRKGAELAANRQAALLFHWKSLRRQVRARGPVEGVTEAESDAYFASRPRDSRIGAWASQQSRPLESRFALEKAVAKFAAKYPVGDVPRPAYWKGFRIRPVQFEFWSDRPFRLHERIDFRRDAPEGDWRKQRLYP